MIIECNYTIFEADGRELAKIDRTSQDELFKTLVSLLVQVLLEIEEAPNGQPDDVKVLYGIDSEETEAGSGVMKAVRAGIRFDIATSRITPFTL